MQVTPEHEKLVSIFFPFASERQGEIRRKGTRLVHYTTAEAATSIIRSKEVWMRPSSCMNDFMEVQHGLNCVLSAYNNGEKAFKQALDRVSDGLSKEIENLFNGWIPHLRTDTYLSCFSEHDEREDAFGRLSMWRAYGQITGVALVVSSAPFLAPSTALKAYASPVAYLSDKDFEKIFSRVTAAIDENADFLRLQGRAMLVNVVFDMLRFAALCTKHPAFEEEREWRVLYCPALESSKHVLKDIKVINGTPQPIYRIPLRDIPDEGLEGVEIPALLDRVIIGPTKYPLAMWKAFDGLLAEAGVEDSASKVFISDIPLRT
jgi:hypothetical protein